MPAESARAYLRDLPRAALHLIEGADHWVLETHFEEALPIVQGLLRAAYDDKLAPRHSCLG